MDFLNSAAFKMIGTLLSLIPTWRQRQKRKFMGRIEKLKSLELQLKTHMTINSSHTLPDTIFYLHDKIKHEKKALAEQISMFLRKVEE